jgi:LPS-assembly lipoprotein
MNGRIAAALLLTGGMAVLAGCGFRLQGSVPLPRSLAAVRIEAGDTQSDFYFGLRKALSAAGTVIDDEGKQDAVAVIHIIRDTSVEHVLTVSALNVPNEYELTYTMSFSVSSNGQVLIPPEEHVLLRDYSYSESAQLAKQRERSILSAALAHDLVTVVMRRLSSLSTSVQAVP